MGSWFIKSGFDYSSTTRLLGSSSLSRESYFLISALNAFFPPVMGRRIILKPTLKADSPSIGEVLQSFGIGIKVPSANASTAVPLSDIKSNDGPPLSPLAVSKVSQGRRHPRAHFWKMLLSWRWNLLLSRLVLPSDTVAGTSNATTTRNIEQEEADSPSVSRTLGTEDIVVAGSTVSPSDGRDDGNVVEMEKSNVEIKPKAPWVGLLKKTDLTRKVLNSRLWRTFRMSLKLCIRIWMILKKPGDFAWWVTLLADFRVSLPF